MEPVLKRRRVARLEDSDEEKVDANALKEIIVESNQKTQTTIKEMVNKCTADVKTTFEGARQTEQYVITKHADQAAMLKFLNAEIRTLREKVDMLYAENSDLKYQLGRHDAFQDCAHMISENTEVSQANSGLLKKLYAMVKKLIPGSV